jgi:hypothetical protein
VHFESRRSDLIRALVLFGTSVVVVLLVLLLVDPTPDRPVTNDDQVAQTNHSGTR